MSRIENSDPYTSAIHVCTLFFQIKKNDLTPDYTEGKGINLKMDAWHM